MADLKPLASLSPSLLARKGAARPAMRPQTYISFNAPLDSQADDLGWNDMGEENPTSSVGAMPGHDIPNDNATVEAPHVVQQQSELVEKLAPTIADVPKPLSRAAPGSRGKAAFTLRLDPERHLQLRLLSALSHRSAQNIVTAALDAMLQEQSSVIALATLQSPKG